jgi:hypothetical protein
MIIGTCEECDFYDPCECGIQGKEPHGHCYAEPPTQTYGFTSVTRDGKVTEEWAPISYTEPREVFADRPGCRFWRK